MPLILLVLGAPITSSSLFFVKNLPGKEILFLHCCIYFFTTVLLEVRKTICFQFLKRVFNTSKLAWHVDKNALFLNKQTNSFFYI
jgi:hypothetical protein